MISKKIDRIGVPLILAIHSALLAYSASVHSPTLNEPAHLAAGISYWEKSRFELYRVNPPLVRLVAALPPVVYDIQTNWKQFYEATGVRPAFTVGNDLVIANGENIFFFTKIARWACIPFSLIGALVCFLWARDLFGTTSAYAALCLWCFSPNILGHASLLTPDAPATALGAAACYSFWRWLKKPTWSMTVVNGLLLGLAELCKSTFIIFYPLWPILWLIYRVPDFQSMSAKNWIREFLMLTLRIVVCLYIVNLGYAFEGSFTQLKDYEFVSSALTGNVEESTHGNRFRESLMGQIPVPLPSNYVAGIDIQKHDLDTYSRPSYLRGVFQNHGWYHYYVYAMLVKMPVGFWALVIAVIVFRLMGKRPSNGTRNESDAGLRDEVFLMIPALVVLGFVSSQTGFNEHLRYVLPIFPFLFIWVSQAIPNVPNRKESLSNGFNWFWIQTMTGWLALAMFAASSVSVFPHNLSYFNEVAGGPENGHRHLIHSNVDWGQDLIYLKKWVDQHQEARPLFVASFNSFNPKHVGFEENEYTELFDDKWSGTPDLKDLTPGHYVLSVNLLKGYPFPIYNSQGKQVLMKEKWLEQFRKLTPNLKIAHTLYVYQIPPRKPESPRAPTNPLESE